MSTHNGGRPEHKMVNGVRNPSIHKTWHVCGDCHRRVHVSKKQTWRAAQARCMACGCGRLYTPAEALELGIEERK
jgi:hypothetical protein